MCGPLQWATCVSTGIKEDMRELLAPSQLGFDNLNGAEIAVHSARHYLSSSNDGHIMVKLDFNNAFTIGVFIFM